MTQPGEERLNQYLEAARKHNRDLDEIDHKNGAGAPGDFDPLIELRTAAQAFRAGISIESWECVAEGLVMMEHALTKAAGDGRFGAGRPKII